MDNLETKKALSQLEASLNYAILKTGLETHICIVHFTKADGSERTMRCTLLPEYLPELPPLHVDKETVNEERLVVWDLEKNGWRSFRLDSIIDSWIVVSELWGPEETDTLNDIVEEVVDAMGK